MTLCSSQVVMLLAGHDTSALALMWAFNYLADHPQYVDAVYHETLRALGPPGLDGKWADFSVDAVMSMPETDRILKEVMRLRPPVFEVTRCPYHHSILFRAGVFLCADTLCRAAAGDESHGGDTLASD